MSSSENASGIIVPVDDVAGLMGFSLKRTGEELLMTRGSSQLRLILNSGAAWRGMSIVPLYSAPVEKDGKFWLDSQSVISLFQAFAGRGQNNRLRFVKGTLPPAPKTAAEPVPAPAPVTAAKVPAPAPVTTTPAATPAQEPKIIAAAKVPKPQPVITAAATPAESMDIEDIDLRLKELDDTLRFNTIPKDNAPVIDVTQAPPAPETPSQPVKAGKDKKAEKAEKAEKKSSEKAQPRLETFRPGDTKSEERENYSGTIRRIRWTYSEGSYGKKVKAVVETDDDADPQVFISGGSIHALFAGSLDNAEGLTSPYTQITASISTSSKGAELIFTPSDFTKAEKLVLNKPRRIAFDFFYPESVIIAKSTQTQQTSVQTSVEEASAPVRPSIQPPTPSKRPRSPSVTTPPSTITIPTSAQSAARLRSARKTIVIDPGHGGKDPGAADNGVVEKNINLAVGLELFRELSARGYNAVMTRNTDVYLTLQERTDIANQRNADLFVSVHVNALPSKKSMTGFEIYIMALPTDKDAMNLAKIENREYIEGKGMDTANVDRRTEMLLKILGDMQQNNKISESTDFDAALYNAGVINSLPMRRIAQAPFFVLRGAGMPAVLLEVGFLTNAREAGMLVNPAYQQKIAQAMAAGIVNYLK